MWGRRGGVVILNSGQRRSYLEDFQAKISRRLGNKPHRYQG